MEQINIRGIEEARIGAPSESFADQAFRLLATQGYRVEPENGYFTLRHDSDRAYELLKAPSLDDLLVLLVITGAWSTNVDRIY